VLILQLFPLGEGDGETSVREKADPSWRGSCPPILHYYFNSAILYKVLKRAGPPPKVPDPYRTVRVVEAERPNSSGAFWR